MEQKSGIKQQGFRYVLDEEILEEKQMWRQKYLCLQSQFSSDIEQLKQTIYRQSATIMQKQFANLQTERAKQINRKNIEVKDLTTRIISIETKVKLLQKQNEVLKRQNKQLQDQLDSQNNTTADMRVKYSNHTKSLQDKYQKQIDRIQKQSNHIDQRSDLQMQVQHLKHKIKQYEKNLQKILPEVQKLKNELSSKNQLIDRIKDNYEKQIKDLKNKNDEIKKNNEDIKFKHGDINKKYNKLIEQKIILESQLDKLKRTRKQVKIQPVYIDRPVEVQKIIQKVVEVQKIVKQYIEPPKKEQIRRDQSQIKQLQYQINDLIRQIECFKENTLQYQLIIKQHQSNTKKYKEERESLVRKIQEQNKQIESVYNYIQKYRGSQQGINENQKIVLHVKADGTYNKTVQKTGTKSNQRGQTSTRKK